MTELQTTEEDSKRWTTVDKWSVFGMMLFATAVAVLFLFKQSLRLDEAQSLWQTSRDPLTLLKLVSQDVHVPLYHLMLHYWQILFGTSLPAVRSLSLIFFVVSIPSFFLLAREAFERRTALFTTALFTLSPFLNWYGSEARMYSLMVLFTVLNMYFFLRLFRRPGNAIWLGYAVTAFFGMYSHYFFFFNFLGQFIFFLFNRKRFPEHAIRNFIVIIVGLAICFSPWVYLVLKGGLASTTQPLLSTPTTVNLFDSFAQYLFGFQDDHFNTLLVSLWPLTMLLAIFALTRKRKEDGETITQEMREGSHSQVFYFLITAFVPILLAFFISFVKPIYLTRYLIVTVPGLYLFLGWFTSTFNPTWRKVFRALLVVGMMVTLATQIFSDQTPVKENFGGAVQYLDQNSGAQDAIVLVPPFIIYPFEYYYSGTSTLESIPEWNRYAGPAPGYDAAKLPQYAQDVTANHANVWLLFSDDNDQGYNQQVRVYFDTHYQRVAMQEFAPNISLYEYKVSY